MSNASIANRRLVTQNLLTSSASAVFADQADVTQTAVQDLSALIDIFCLYDQASAIGAGRMEALYVRYPDFYDFLRTDHFIQTETPGAERMVNILTAASKHLVTYLGTLDPVQQDTVDPDRYLELLEFFLDARVASEVAEGYDDLEMGLEWLRTVPSSLDKLVEQLEIREPDALLGTQFLLRTFLYLAYADEYYIPFTSDAVRCDVLEKILDKEEELRGLILQRLKQSTGASAMFRAYLPLERITPLASVVFERAYPERSNIPQEMVDLRAELAPLRKRLGKAEQEALEATRDEEFAAEDRWTAILAELSRRYTQARLTQAPISTILRRANGTMPGVGDIADKPASAGAWIRGMVGAPLELLPQWSARRPVIELHRLRRNLEGSGVLNERTHRLFGDLTKP